MGNKKNLQILNFLSISLKNVVNFQEYSSINDCITSNISLSHYIVQTHKWATTEFGQYMSISSANSSFLSQSLFEEANKEYDVSTLIMG